MHRSGAAGSFKEFTETMQQTGRTTVTIVLPGASTVLFQDAWQDKDARLFSFSADVIK